MMAIVRKLNTLQKLNLIFIPNCHWNHTKFDFGMIPVVIWYEYHTSVFAVQYKICNYHTKLIVIKPGTSRPVQTCTWILEIAIV